ncbi:MAG TPA: CotH kinase family protein, partial [Draconibacterium sp.]|nr:CotH kinase family protein [Draconibacterium sp.]
MKLFLLISFLVLFALMSNAQIITSSNLPIVIINTDINSNTGWPTEIPDEPKIGATMKIIFRSNGSRNYISDANNPEFLNYSGRIAIEKRGSSSQTLPKKPYGLTTLKEDNATNNNVSILGMPKENDWVLNSLAFDPSLIRNYLSYDLARSTGNYAARGEYCEVVINGDYKGLYIFMEKLKIDDERINIAKMTNADNTLPQLTGGYVTKADKTTGGDPVAWTMQSYSGTTSYLHDNPKPAEITSQQNNYIRGQFTILQNAVTAQNASIINGFPSVIDIPSFIDFMLINELASNADAYQYSTYFHKDRNGKLRAGPVWDFDLTYGNDLFHWGFNRSHYYVWQFDNGDNTGSRFWRDLYNNPTYKCYLSKRWQELISANSPLNYNVITERMDLLVSMISEAAAREN